jgi:hypothetical protein
MATKLTLRIDEDLIAQGNSVSRLVADDFAGLPAQVDPQESAGDAPDPPLVDSLRGVLKGTKLGRDDYLRHLDRKHRQASPACGPSTTSTSCWT